MGVSGFYRYILKNYPSCIKKERTFLKTPYLFFDYNGLIHPVVQIVLKSVEEQNLDISEYELIKRINEEIIKYTDKIINYIRPSFVYIAMDGVAPRAKMIQQRLRRFKSAKERDISRFDTNCISPGTNFMALLSVRLNQYFYNEVPKFVNNYKFSDTSEPGEGEHSIINYIKNYCNDKKTQCIIYGLDADLIMLCMSTLLPHMYLLREIQHFEVSYNSSIDIDQLQLQFLCIDALKYSMLLDIEKTYHIRIKKDEFFIKDWIFLTFFLGNDFLPHLKAIDIYNNGVQILLKVYCDILKKTRQNESDFLIRKDNSINMFFLRKMFYTLSRNEENYIIENIKHNKHKGNVLDDYPIRYCYKGWYNRYYDYYYKTHSEDYIEKVVEDYFKTIIWTKDYYFTGCPCWKHYFKYKGLLLSSLNYYLQKNNINDIIFKETKPYTSSQQLMMILPPESKKLVEEKYQKLMTDIDSELIEFYPIEFQLEKMDKSRDWMHEPILPHYDEKILLKYV